MFFRRLLSVMVTVVVAMIGLCPTIAECGIFKKSSDAGTPYRRLARAGYPHLVAPWAHLSVEPKEKGYFVGGGAAFFGEPPYAEEGTWGWDYVPWYSRVRLRWFHGRRYQGGGGQYEPDRHNDPFKHFPGR